MADTLSPEQRSRNMSRIRGKDTKPEMLIRRILHAAGYRFRLHGTYRAGRLPGKPDLVFAGRRKVIFVNGCFWHMHSCRAGLHAPATNAGFWAAKRSATNFIKALQAVPGWEQLEPTIAANKVQRNQDPLPQQPRRKLRAPAW